MGSPSPQALDTSAIGWACVWLLLLALGGCVGSGETSPVERAMYRQWAHQRAHRDISGVSCRQHGDPYTGPNSATPITAYACHPTGGGKNDMIEQRVFWDGHQILEENELTRAQVNALMFD
jgi:hypothetical protein